jgi:hypothetical protein
MPTAIPHSVSELQRLTSLALLFRLTSTREEFLGTYILDRRDGIPGHGNAENENTMSAICLKHLT